MTNAPQWDRVKQVFQEALEHPAEERLAWLRSRCADDSALEAEVQSWLATHEQIGSFAEWPALELLSALNVDELAVTPPVLRPGDRLGVFEIRDLIGAGGMGEVYSAHDVKLRRDVAIKILPSAFTADRERVARFEREARVLASLNHPNIAAIYGIEPVGDAQALVLELVDGETLAERLLTHSAFGHQPITLNPQPLKPLPFNDALSVARQIAVALEAAHEKGIIHRDLKPANIKITKAGTVKVLDFGLAKAASEDTSDISKSPTITIPGTSRGVLLGTAAYMSPEQVRGHTVDKRTDIWAFGCVLYEMLTGRAAFAGETTPDQIAAVLDREPDYSALPPGTTTAVGRLLRRCLEKDLKRRLPDIAVARLEIEEPANDAVTAAGSIRRLPGAIGAATAALAAVALTLVMVAGLIRRDRPSDTITLDFNAPTGYRFLTTPATVAISPDGQQVVFPAIPVEAGKSGSQFGIEDPGLRRADGSRDREARQALLNIRALSSPTARPLLGTDGGTFPFWSPDGRFVGFVSNGVLKKIAVIDGAVMKLANGAYGRATWSSAGIVLFSGTDGRLHRVSENGGATTIVSEIDESRGEEAHAWPVFLPDGRRFIYLARSSTDLAKSVVYLSSLDSTARTRLLSGDTSVEYASGHLLYRRSDSLVAQRFDAATAQLTGDPTPIIEGIASEPLSGGAAVSASQNGVMIYGRGQSGWVVGGLGALTWFDRSGGESDAISPPGYYRYASVSPDGRHVAVTFSADGQSFDVWQIDLERNVPARFTFNGDDDFWPVAWSWDARYLAFASRPPSARAYDLYRRLADGAAADELLFKSPEHKSPTGFSPDGKILLFTRQKGPRQDTDIWALPIGDSRGPFPVVNTPFNEGSAVFSPDGRWIAYVSDDAGATQVYVQPFPSTGARVRLSTTSGTWPMWTRSGREVVYATTEQEFMAVNIMVAGQAIRVSAPRKLFAHPYTGSHWNSFAVDPTGDRFLLTLPQKETHGAMTVVLNWPSLLRKK